MSKILIIEDDVVLNKMYAKKFQLEGFEVRSAFSGQEGINSAKAEKPDAILLDIMMPVVDGFTVMRELKPYLDHVPIIVLTNLGTSEVFVDEAKTLGAKEYLVKYKASTEEVLETVKKYIK